MTVQLIPGDCMDVMARLKADGVCVQSVVTDPPYHMTSIVKRFGKAGSAPAVHGSDGLYSRASKGFMGQEWDGGDIAFRSELWRLVFDLLPPGGHLFAFSGTRTYHRMAVAIEDAGFEIRDQFGWAYGTGFPKSHNQSGDWKGWGTAAKPAWEPICLARKPLDGTIAANVLKYGTGALNIDACRIEAFDSQLAEKYASVQGSGARLNSIYGSDGRDRNGSTPHDLGRWPANIVHDGSAEVRAAFPGGADRFFYSAKADGDDRFGSKHPTVKPVDLMRWLVTMITPLGGTVLDPFAGTGSTGIAAYGAGFNALLIERDPDYQKDIQTRIDHVTGNGGHSFAVNARHLDEKRTSVDALPLFGGAGTSVAGGGVESTGTSRATNRTGGVEDMTVPRETGSEAA